MSEDFWVVVMIVILVILCVGDPDLLDAISCNLYETTQCRELSESPQHTPKNKP